MRSRPRPSVRSRPLARGIQIACMIHGLLGRASMIDIVRRPGPMCAAVGIHMKTAILLSLSAIVLAAAPVACSAPAPAGDGKNSADATAKKKSSTKETKGDDDDDSTKKPAKKTTPDAKSGDSTTSPSPKD